MYIFPLCDEDNWEQGSDNGEVQRLSSNEDFHKQFDGHNENNDNLHIDIEGELESVKKPRSFTVSRVNLLLQQLEGKLLSYKMFARDTKASRSM